MNSIQNNINQIRQQIRQYTLQFNKNSDDILLLAVSKKHPVEHLAQAIEAGCRDFGESYVQEAIGKMDVLTDQALTWHFIGPIQSNKTQLIASRFDWVHSVDRIKIAQRLSQQRPSSKLPLNICIQVNISKEDTKSGVSEQNLTALADQIRQLPGLNLRGLMAIPAKSEQSSQQREMFAAVRMLFDDLNTKGFALDTLSMGMSNDMRAAIAEGSTVLRIGTALFGERN